MRLYVRIIKNENKYDASLLAENGLVDHNGEELWQTVKSLNREQLTEVLNYLGFHQRDIFDAFDQAEGKHKNIEHPLFKVKE